MFDNDCREFRNVDSIVSERRKNLKYKGLRQSGLIILK